MKKIFFAFVFAILFAAGPLFPNQMVNGWLIGMDNTGAIGSMGYENPKTPLNIESLIVINPDYQGQPAKGSVKFRDGVERALNFPEETACYYTMLLGPATWWDVMKTQDHIASTDPQIGPLPTVLYGRMSRIIINDGREFVGKLAENMNNPDWFYVIVDGKSVSVYRPVVREIQQTR